MSWHGSVVETMGLKKSIWRLWFLKKISFAKVNVSKLQFQKCTEYHSYPFYIFSN